MSDDDEPITDKTGLDFIPNLIGNRIGPTDADWSYVAGAFRRARARRLAIYTSGEKTEDLVEPK